MDTLGLKKKIDIILSNELSLYRNSVIVLPWFYRGPSSGGTMPSSMSYFYFVSSLPEISSYKLDSKNLNLLIKLYNIIKKDKILYGFMMEYLIELPHNKETIFSTSYIVPYFLIKTKNEFRMMEFFRNVGKINSTELKKNVSLVLACMLYYENEYFDDKFLDLLKELLQENRLPKEFTEEGVLLNIINRVQHKRLSIELDEGSNFEIDQDKDKVIEKMKHFGFSENLSVILNKINDYYWDTKNDEFEYSMAIGKIREFFSELVKEVTDRIYEKTKEKIPTTKNTGIANMREYLKMHLHLTNENKLIDELVELTNKKGSHSLISSKEHFRLIKNIGIELALLILTKLEQFEKS